MIPGSPTGAPPAAEKAETAAGELSEWLAIPRPQDEVERIESSILRRWAPKIAQPMMAGEDARAFMEFFREIGFIYKYKPYGVKIASAFGYSIFDLAPGQGFSFQVHTKPKREAFHVLQVHPGGFVFLSSRQEWDEGAGRWVQDWAAGRQPAGSQPCVWEPSPGQTIPVSDPNTVHTVIGCVLEEFASCSVDAVERLFDQNRRSSVVLPDRHPGIDSILSRCHPGLPVSSVVRQGGGWIERPAGPESPIIDVAGQFVGRRMALAAGRPQVLPAVPGRLTSLVPVRGGVRCRAVDQQFHLRVGEMLCVPPGWEATVDAEAEATLAVHLVSSDVILQDWS